MNGAEVDIRPECFKQKNSNEIKILEKVYTNCILGDGVGYVVFPQKEWNQYSSTEFQNVLEYIRFVKVVDAWVAFVKNDDGYTVYAQGNATGKFDITKTLKPYDGTGSRKKTKCKIADNQINEIIDVCKKMVAEGKLKEKPRKKYTHKIKKEVANEDD